MAQAVSLLLDSCIIIDILRRHPQAVDLFKGLMAKPMISVVTITELRSGQRGDRDRRLIDDVLSSSDILDVDQGVAEIAGQLMQSFRRSHALETADALIAATAIHYSLELVTLNIKHFPMFPALQRPY